jgi:hypothetical protein
MDIIHIAHDRSGRLRKRLATQTTQKILGCEPPVNIPHAGRDELTKLELMPALAISTVRTAPAHS